MPPKARTTPARKPNPGRRTPKQSVSTVLQLDRQENVDALAAMIADREPLFAVGGVEYTIPKQAPAAWTIRAVELATTVSIVSATEYAFQTVLGDAGYRALVECKTLTAADLQVIRTACLDRVIPGGFEAPKS